MVRAIDVLRSVPGVFLQTVLSQRRAEALTVPLHPPVWPVAGEAREGKHCNGRRARLFSKEKIRMGLIDFIADRSFRDDQAGRVVIFGGNFRSRGYRVGTKAEELKIKSFIKMFAFAQLSIQLLGMYLAMEWSRELNEVLGRPAKHLVRSLFVYLGIYTVVVLLPLWLLWRSHKKERLNFVSAQDEVVVTSKAPRDKRFYQVIGVAVFFFLIAAGVVFLIRFR
jgi:hypothetical protein